MCVVELPRADPCSPCPDDDDPVPKIIELANKRWMSTEKMYLLSWSSKEISEQILYKVQEISTLEAVKTVVLTEDYKPPAMQRVS